MTGTAGQLYYLRLALYYSRKLPSLAELLTPYSKFVFNLFADNLRIETKIPISNLFCYADAIIESVLEDEKKRPKMRIQMPFRVRCDDQPVISLFEGNVGDRQKSVVYPPHPPEHVVTLVRIETNVTHKATRLELRQVVVYERNSSGRAEFDPSVLPLAEKLMMMEHLLYHLLAREADGIQRFIAPMQALASTSNKKVLTLRIVLYELAQLINNIK